ncbi:universal stress protein [Williamsia muralis]|uniref:universal stress protein n=1 Tax=Williamsia marianensis TaxID=85044 RepID=UPI003F1893EF
MTTESTTAPVIVGIDGSQSALGAARWAAEYAEKVNAPVELVFALPGNDWYMALGEAALISERALLDQLREVGARYLKEAQEATGKAASTVRTTATISEDEIVDFIRKRSPDAQLVVIGSRRSGPVRDLLLGSQVIPITNAAQCPVLAWRPSADAAVDMHTDVVVGIDGSEHADKALLAAFEHAHLTGTRLVIAHFWQVSALVGVGYAGALIDWEQLRDNGNAWLRDHVAGMRDKFPDVEVRLIYGDASPAHGLADLSASAGVVVVGSRGRGAVSGTLLGSVSQNLLHHSRCSVLVVH